MLLLSVHIPIAGSILGKTAAVRFLSRHLRYCCLLVAMLVLIAPAMARELDFAKLDAAPIALDQTGAWAQDLRGDLTFDQVRSDTGPLRFLENPGHAWSPSFDPGTAAIWVKVPVFNSSASQATRVLVFARPGPHALDVYFEAQDGSLHSTRFGHSDEPDSSFNANRLLTVPIVLKPQERQTIWIRAQSSGAVDLEAQWWDVAAFAAANVQDARRYGWMGGISAALLMVFCFMWVATGQKAFAWFGTLLLAGTWRVAENSGHLSALLGWRQLQTAPIWLAAADLALLLCTVGLLYEASADNSAHRPYRTLLKSLAGFAIALPLLLFLPTATAGFFAAGILAAYALLWMGSAWLALRGERVFIWYTLALLVPAFSFFLQSLPDVSGIGDVWAASYMLDSALVQGLLVLSGAVAFDQVCERQAHMRQLRTLLSQQNSELEKSRQAEIDLEAQVSQRTQELAAAARRLEGLSSIDGMTGVANRRRFDETLPVEWGRAARDKRPLSIALIDVDWFKTYNDKYGHQAGDECLRQLARVFEAGVMRSGDLIARYGGEEFVLIAPDTDLNGIHTIASYLCQEVFALGIHNESSPFGRVSISVGVATAYPHQGSKPASLIEQADLALYRAKQAGRHRVAGPETPGAKA